MKSGIIGMILLAGNACAEDLADLHLHALPRTAEETARIAEVLAQPVVFDRAQRFEDRPGGAATVVRRGTADAFSLPSANMTFDARMDFELGKAFFDKLWVGSPASTLASDGLGPLYNARACQACHRRGGRGVPQATDGDRVASLFLRVSLPGGQAQSSDAIEGYFRTQPDPVYGGQLQDFALPGHRPEYRLAVTYRDQEVPLSGGERATLRVPTYRAADLGYGPLAEGAMLSPRIAPQMIGLGLLEAIPTEDILALADPQDADGDGISGKAQILWSAEFDRPMLGRFGLKAGAPTLKEQSASAFAHDIGISNPLFPQPAGDCTTAQVACRTARHGDGDARGFEIDGAGLDLVTFYAGNLGVPARSDAGNPSVLRGKQVFHDAGCAACHQPNFVTQRLGDRPEHSFQLIWPYTDMLLHDMGPGLADNRPEGRADGTEWRTAPLWGIGLTRAVSGQSVFLHDGRARSLLEAILWHGGEAQASRDRVVTMPPEDRANLLEFLESL